MAIGLSLKTEKFEKFKQAFEKYAKAKHVENLIPELLIDTVITSKDMILDEIKKLELLEPFGEGNALPVILYKNLKIDSIRALSDGKHLKLLLTDGNTLVDSIGFNMGYLSSEYQIGDKVDIVGNIGINRFRDMENIQITLKDIRSSI